jgi:uncharacterized protein YrzB (UPF0473 family)
MPTLFVNCGHNAPVSGKSTSVGSDERSSLTTILPYSIIMDRNTPKEDFTMEDKELLTEEEQTNILTLTDENGEDTEFEYLDSIEYEGKEYLVLMPAEELATEIVILEVEPVDEENENYISVADEAVLNAVYDIFKDRYKDVLTFED